MTDEAWRGSPAFSPVFLPKLQPGIEVMRMGSLVWQGSSQGNRRLATEFSDGHSVGMLADFGSSEGLMCRSGVLPWMGEILHHLRNRGMMIPW